MAVKYAPSKLTVPPGFQNLLESLSREVLREQPEDVIKFAAQYFRNQIVLREDSGNVNTQTERTQSPATAPPTETPAAQRTETPAAEATTAVKEEEQIDIDISDPAVEDAAVKIQAAFRGHKSRQDIKESTSKENVQQDSEKVNVPDDAAASEETAESPSSVNAQVDDKGEETKDESEAKPDSEAIDIDLDDPATEAAAVKIQASFRGHKSRQELKASKSSLSTGGEQAVDESNSRVNASAGAIATETETTADVITSSAPSAEDATVPAEDESAVQEAAAIRIQSSFRGHQVRKEIKASKSNTQVDSNDDDVSTKVEASDQLEADAEDVVNVVTEEDIDNTPEAAVDPDVNVDDSLVTPVSDLTATDDGGQTPSEEDPEATKAAIKIQASFRGHQVRKNMKGKPADEEASGDDTPGVDDVEEGN